MATNKKGRTTPKKDKTDLEQRFADSGLPAEEVQQEAMRIPSREAQIKVQAINDDHLLFTFAADNGMSLNNYTISYDQIMAILEGMEPWLTMERAPKPEETDLTVVQSTLVGPDGRPLI